ncbi:MAG: radical SAM protein [Muribaculaceae bacterium]
MILSFVDGGEKNQCIKNAANYLGVEQKLVADFIERLIDNPNQVYLKSKDGISSFPPRTIVSSSTPQHEKRYDAEIFDYDNADVTMKRHFTPSTLTLMVNNVCLTDCVYCYQDKSRVANCSIPLERILQIIHEAKKLHVNTFDVIGGEFFLYKHWKEVLSELSKLGYSPYLSTKMPLSTDIVGTLAELRIKDIQISLDTLIEEHLIQSLGVKKGYAQQMIDTLRLLNENHIPVMVHSVVTRHNGAVDDMKSIYDVLCTLPNVIDWHIVKGDPTLYPRRPYSEIEVSDHNLSTISAYLNSLKPEADFNIRTPMPDVSTETVTENSDNNQGKTAEEAFFSNRTFCSGLFSALYILPDGKVTMCEQLYWNPQFIIGDVCKNSIAEIWNSEKAKSLFFIQQDQIPADSLCHSCARFDNCRNLRQVCYREIVKKYGNSRWYYPDVNCPFAQ